MRKNDTYSVEVQNVTFTAIITKMELSDDKRNVRVAFKLTRSDTKQSKDFAVLLDNQKPILDSARLSAANSVESMWKFPPFTYDASAVVWGQKTCGFPVGVK